MHIFLLRATFIRKHFTRISMLVALYVIGAEAILGQRRNVRYIYSMFKTIFFITVFYVFSAGH